MVYCACHSWAFVKFCVCPSFLFGIEGRMWDDIVLIPDYCLSIYFILTKTLVLEKIFLVRSTLQIGISLEFLKLLLIWIKRYFYTYSNHQ